jgi:hypothetical protein
MNVIDFLCVSLGNSTVQLHHNLGNRRACACSNAGFCRKNDDLACGMYYRGRAFSCGFLWANWLNAKHLLKCLSRKAVQRWCQTFCWWRSWNGCAEVAETTVKKILCCGFRRSGKAMTQVCQRWWRICRETNIFFQVRISHVLLFISICDVFTNCPSYYILVVADNYHVIVEELPTSILIEWLD